VKCVKNEIQHAAWIFQNQEQRHSPGTEEKAVIPYGNLKDSFRRFVAGWKQ
jgi:hypothetical protein